MATHRDLNAIASVVISLSVVYFLAAMFAGMHEYRKAGVPLSEMSRSRYFANPFLRDLRLSMVYALIPCLNEEAVIASTVAALSGGMRTTTIVIDDASEDRTSEVAALHRGDRTIVLRRSLPHARQGKRGSLKRRVIERLNGSYRERRVSCRVLVSRNGCRMADFRRRPSLTFLPLFEDSRVAGASSPYAFETVEQTS